MIQRILFIALLVSMWNSCLKVAHAQGESTLIAGERRLSAMLDQIKNSPDDEERVMIHDQFLAAFLELLQQPGSFHYPFDSLKIIFKLELAPAGARLFSWDLPASDGQHELFGIMLLNKGKNAPYEVILLSDQADSVQNPSQVELAIPNWYGAVYYQAVPFKVEGEDLTHFLLLGWRGVNNSLSSRVIDVMTQDVAGFIRFGRVVFCMDDKKPVCRVIFKYSTHSSMALRYEVQAFLTEKKWNARKKRFDFEYKKSPMVVNDRMVPQEKHLEGQYEFYVASSDVVDGFVFDGVCWKQVFDIEARNPSENQQKTSKIPEK